jgi:hypothetical protein
MIAIETTQPDDQRLTDAGADRRKDGVRLAGVVLRAAGH